MYLAHLFGINSYSELGLIHKNLFVWVVFLFELQLSIDCLVVKRRQIKWRKCLWTGWSYDKCDISNLLSKKFTNKKKIFNFFLIKFAKIKF